MSPNYLHQRQHSIDIAGNLDEQLVNSALCNQTSRSRKPFNLTEYEATANVNATASLKHNNTIPNTSFDDLDAVEVVNLNTNSSRIHSIANIQNKQFQNHAQQQSNIIVQQSQQHKTSSNPYFYTNSNSSQNSGQYHSQENLNYNQQQHYPQQQNQLKATTKKHPVSILKRFDSSEKMNPISRPASNSGQFPCNITSAVSQSNIFMNQNDVHKNFNNHQYNGFQANSNGISTGDVNCGGTFPRNTKPHRVNMPPQQKFYSHDQTQDLSSNTNLDNIYDQQQQMLRNNNINDTTKTPNIHQIRQKRVQFANIPPSPANAVQPGMVPNQQQQYPNNRNTSNGFMNNNNNLSRHHRHRSSHHHHNSNRDNTSSSRRRRSSSSSSSAHHQNHHSSSTSLAYPPHNNNNNNNCYQQQQQQQRIIPKPNHRRSSSTSNFNTSTMSSKSHHRHSNSSSRHSNKSKSNRSLIDYSDHDRINNNNNNNDYETNSACEFDYDNDEDECHHTCSTCSSTNSTNTTSSTSSSTDDDNSDFDDFGCDPALEAAYSKFYSYQNKNPQQQRITNFANKSLSSNPNNNPENNSSSRRYNSGLKISYVDNLPLARTNPAVASSSSTNPSNGAHKKSSTSKSSSSGKKKAISKFKKDNCVVS
jgi:hypothetical protein